VGIGTVGDCCGALTVSFRPGPAIEMNPDDARIAGHGRHQGEKSDHNKQDDEAQVPLGQEQMDEESTQSEDKARERVTDIQSSHEVTLFALEQKITHWAAGVHVIAGLVDLSLETTGTAFYPDGLEMSAKARHGNP